MKTHCSLPYSTSHLSFPYTNGLARRIWRRARLNHYPGPGLGEVLPLGLGEYELFDLTTGKMCDYCETKKKVRPYYIWSVRCCQVCLFE